MILTLNSKQHFINADSLVIDELGSGRFNVTYNDDRTFEVMGGTKSGGTSREWFVKHELFYGDRYWVSAAFVNGSTPGFVHKDYELKLGAQ